MLSLITSIDIPAEATESSADIQSFLKSWGDWIAAAYQHSVGFVLLTALLIFAIAEMLAFLCSKGAALFWVARRKVAPEVFLQALRDFLGPCFNLIFGVLAVVANGMAENKAQLWFYGTGYAAVAFLMHLAWIYRRKLKSPRAMLLAWLGKK